MEFHSQATMHLTNEGTFEYTGYKIYTPRGAGTIFRHCICRFAKICHDLQPEEAKNFIK